MLLSAIPAIIFWSSVSLTLVDGASIDVAFDQQGPVLGVETGSGERNKSVEVNAFNIVNNGGCCKGDDAKSNLTKPRPPPTTEVPLFSLVNKEPWVLVVGGYLASHGFSSATDLISLDPTNRPVPPCLRSRRTYPFAIRAGVGASIYGRARDPLVCGGIESSRGINECHIYNPESNTWRRGSNMDHGRDWPAASVHPHEGLVITGGHSNSGHFQTSVETTPNGFSFRRPFTDLPAGSHGHCQVTVDADTIMVFGGNLGEKPYKLDVAHGGVWVALPPMSGKRFGPACGLTNGRKTVVVAGGRSAPNVPLATVELLDIERLTWTTGTSLPRPIWAASSVAIDDTFAIVGGNENGGAGAGSLDTVYLRDAATGQWNLLSEKLSVARGYIGVAFPVDWTRFPHC